MHADSRDLDSLQEYGGPLNGPGGWLPHWVGFLLPGEAYNPELFYCKAALVCEQPFQAFILYDHHCLNPFIGFRQIFASSWQEGIIHECHCLLTSSQVMDFY